VGHCERGSRYTSIQFAQVLDDHDVLQSVGSGGDALDNDFAESVVPHVRTEPIADRV
jgi:transposase InsO family protein